MFKSWDDEAWDDYLYWQNNDKKTLRRINQLLKDIERIGKPEPLKHKLHGYWGRRIDETNRLVYRLEKGRIEIIQCRTHYESS